MSTTKRQPKPTPSRNTRINDAVAASPAIAAAFCHRMLPRVSRTFALNIPQLPAPLDVVVTVAYLLCRIADTVEDESSANASERAHQLAKLAHVARLKGDWRADANQLSQRIAGSLREQTPEAERDLALGLTHVLECYAQQPSWSHGHVSKCIDAMTGGMAELSASRGNPEGFRNLDETMLYCHYVAGTVGEMLTALFVGYSPEVATQGAFLKAHAGAFGRALQLTNILQDVYADFERGSCWLPKTTMARHGLTPAELVDPAHRDRALEMMGDMIAVAHREALLALDYTLAIPTSEPGIRTFCLWPLFNAVLTLRALQDNAHAFSPKRVKIKRSVVLLVMKVTSALATHDRGLRLAFNGATVGLRREVPDAND